MYYKFDYFMFIFYLKILIKMKSIFIIIMINFLKDNWLVMDIKFMVKEFIIIIGLISVNILLIINVFFILLFVIIKIVVINLINEEINWRYVIVNIVLFKWFNYCFISFFYIFVLFSIIYVK